VACSYARIFYRNAVDGGYFPPLESEQDLTAIIRTGDLVSLDIEGGTLIHRASGQSFTLKPLGVAAEIVTAGGLFEYARRAGIA
jgi:3-isopropylmalate/(R)-2-methylmalate dehydratase small subunit